jgi:hypothetical protein
VRLVVDLALHATAAGGRRNGIEAGYRPNWDNGDRLEDGRVHFHDASIVALETPRLEPGARTTAELIPHFSEFWDHVLVGTGLRMCEGPREVGSAIVRQVTREADDIPAR